jgi:hypothetical protein
VKARLADGVSANTINRSVEAVVTILNRAARSYRDADSTRIPQTGDMRSEPSFA